MLFSDHCLSRLAQCDSMKFGIFVLLFRIKLPKDLFEFFGRYCSLSLKSGKTRKISHVLMSRDEKRADLCLVFLAQLEA